MIADAARPCLNVLLS